MSNVEMSHGSSPACGLRWGKLSAGQLEQLFGYFVQMEHHKDMNQ